MTTLIDERGGYVASKIGQKPPHSHPNQIAVFVQLSLSFIEGGLAILESDQTKTTEVVQRHV